MKLLIFANLPIAIVLPSRQPNNKKVARLFQARDEVRKYRWSSPQGSS